MPELRSEPRQVSDMPLFTVLIPTMNRPELLEVAIRTTLDQVFSDFEIIVSDNSSSEEYVTLNQAVIRKYSGDARLHYIRPPQWMSMPDHWEFASRHSQGQYLTILTDRLAMRPSALQILKNEIERLPPECRVISWTSDSSLSRFGIMYTAPFSARTEIMKSLDMIRDFTALKEWRSAPVWTNRLPRMLNGCFRRDLAEEIREKHGRLFMPLSPDYTSAFLLLAYSEQVAFIDRPLFMSHGAKSTGRNSLVFGSDAYLASLGDVDWYLDVPAPFYTATSMLLRDFLQTKRLVSPRYDEVTLDVPGYFLCNYREFLQMQHLGSIRNVGALYDEWWAAIGKLPASQQAEIRSGVRELEKQRPSFIYLRRLVVRLRVVGIVQDMMNAMRHIQRRLQGVPVYSGVLDAVKRSDRILKEAQSG